ncbi:MAG: hypothetical protein HC893_16245 [Chloroflexaceae bacterium]|nr:hypothetical protein [Chloroflexaceae bacterium]
MSRSALPTSDVTYQAAALQMACTRLQQGQSLVVRVQGNSMLPLLRPGDVVRVEPVSINGIRSGDVLLVAYPHTLLMHRLIAHTAHGWQTKGDNRSLPDAPVPAPAIVGRVVAVQRQSHWHPLATPATWRAPCKQP